MTGHGHPVAVDLWVWPLDVDDAERGRLAAFLSQEEAARAQHFVFAKDRERFIVAHGRLREILGRQLKCSPGDVTFTVSAHGKPTLAGQALHFNLTHSEGLAAVVTADLELGVDIEFVRPLKDDVAKRYFSRREIASLAALPADDQLSGFYRCWTRKEAIVKAIGEGLTRALDSFDVSVAADQAAVVERLEGEADASRRWRLMHFEPALSFVGAIACRTGGAQLAIHRRDAASALL